MRRELTVSPLGLNLLLPHQRPLKRKPYLTAHQYHHRRQYYLAPNLVGREDDAALELKVECEAPRRWVYLHVRHLHTLHHTLRGRGEYSGHWGEELDLRDHELDREPGRVLDHGLRPYSDVLQHSCFPSSPFGPSSWPSQANGASQLIFCAPSGLLFRIVG